MARRRRTKPRPPAKRDRMARVCVADDVWTDFRTLAAHDSISAVLGGLVEREVDRHRARRLISNGQKRSHTCTVDATSTRLRARPRGSASGMGRRYRQRARAATSPAAAARPPSRMARVAVPDEVWADFRALAEPRSIATALGELVQGEVDRDHARRLKHATLDDTEFVDALDRVRDLHEDLTQTVARLERRLDRTAKPVDPDA